MNLQDVLNAEQDLRQFAAAFRSAKDLMDAVGTVKVLVSNIDEHEKKLASLTTEVDVAKRQLAVIKGEMGSAQHEVTRAKSELANAQKEMAALASKLFSK